MTSQINNSPDHMMLAYSAYSNGQMVEGHNQFSKCEAPLQNRVFEQMWVNRGSPTGNPEYGRHTFNDIHGHYSTPQEKATAIDPVVKDLLNREYERTLTGKRPVYKNVYNHNDRSYTHHFSHYEHVPSAEKFGGALAEITPKNIDPATDKKIGVGVMTTVTVGYMLVFVCEFLSKWGK